MNMFRLCFIVPQTINGALRRKAVFEAVELDDKGNPKRLPEGGIAPLNAADGKPLRASMLLGDWQAGTGLLEAELRRGGKIATIDKFVLSRPGQFTETKLSDGTVSQVAKIASGYHVYVRAEAEARVKDGKPVLGTDGRQVYNIQEPTWVLYASATGTFAITAANTTPPPSTGTVDLVEPAE